MTIIEQIKKRADRLKYSGDLTEAETQQLLQDVPVLLTELEALVEFGASTAKQLHDTWLLVDNLKVAARELMECPYDQGSKGKLDALNKVRSAIARAEQESKLVRIKSLSTSGSQLLEELEGLRRDKEVLLKLMKAIEAFRKHVEQFPQESTILLSELQRMLANDSEKKV